MKLFITTCIVGDGRYAVNKKSQRRTELFTVQYSFISKIFPVLICYIVYTILIVPSQHGRSARQALAVIVQALPLPQNDLSQLQKCATADDAATFSKYLSDSYLSDFAARALMSTPGIDNQVIDLMKAGSAPKNVLANIASFRKLNSPEVEPILLSWVKGADANTLPAIYDALAACGSVKSLNVLKAAAQNATYPSNAMDSYLGLLNNLTKVGQAKKVMKEAKALMKNGNGFIQNAALQLLMKNDKANVPSYLLSALRKYPD